MTSYIPHQGIAETLNLLQSDDNSDEVNQWVNSVVSEFPDKVKAYQNGKRPHFIVDRFSTSPKKDGSTSRKAKEVW